MMGLVSRWSINIKIEEHSQEGQVRDLVRAAMITWPPHYREAHVQITALCLADTQRAFEVFIHEMIHLYIANVQDFLKDNLTEATYNLAMDEIEESTSEITNLLVNVLQNQLKT